MNDCEAAISNKKLIEVGQILNTKILWILREINKADKVAKSKINKKKKVLRDLNFFMKLVFGKPILLNAKKKIPEHAMINPLSSLTTIMLEEVLSQKELFPVSTKDFTPLVMKVASKNDIALKKGDIQKIRKELCDTNYIVMKNKMISLI